MGDMHGCAGHYRLARLVVVDIGDVRIETVAWLDSAHFGKEIARMHVAQLHVPQIDGDAIARVSRIDRIAVDLDRPDARLLLRREDLHNIARRGGTAPERPRKHSAGTLDREHTVDRVSHGRTVVDALGLRRSLLDSREQIVEPFARLRRYRDDRRIRIRGIRQMRTHIVHRYLDPFLIDQVDFRQRDDA